jgi:hypothetical protein
MPRRNDAGHGGYRNPANPAPVSGPGAMSRRTDGGPTERQPIRVASGGAYGARQALETQQQAAPLPNTMPTPAGPGRGPGLAPVGPSVFGPTARPNEPVTAGLRSGPAILGDDPDVVLRALYRLFPHPDIARLLRY